MRGKGRRDVDEAIAELAERQHGKVSRKQLLALGLGARAIEYRLAKGLLRPDYRGVYSLGHRPQSRESRWMAAGLYAGDGAASDQGRTSLSTTRSYEKTRSPKSGAFRSPRRQERCSISRPSYPVPFWRG